MIKPEIQELIIDVSEGNPGALNVLISLYCRNAAVIEELLKKMLEIKLTGPKIWELYKNKFNEDIELLQREIVLSGIEIVALRVGVINEQERRYREEQGKYRSRKIEQDNGDSQE